MADHFNEIMPESDARVLCIRITKPISYDGFKNNFLPHLESLLKTSGEIRLLVDYADFRGWEAQAALEDFETFFKFGTKIKKMAFVSPPEKEIFKLKINRPLIGGEIRFFNKDELDVALDWVRE